jgi:type II secretory pathway pseudopilin PulG
MKQDLGFSTVEMLIAMCIAIVVLAATMSYFNTSLGLNEKATEIAELEQNLRAGMNFMSDDFIYAGWGIPIGGIPIPSGSGADPVIRPGPPGASIYFTSDTLAAVNPGPALGPAVNGRATDIVNILYADNLLELDEYVLTNVAANGASITVNGGTSISGDYPIRVGDLIMLSNALGSTLQYVTGVEGQTIHFATGDEDKMNLNQPGFPGSVTELADASGMFPPTSAKRVYLVSFYLELADGGSLPSLVRRVNDQDGRVVAQVLEDLQISYDLVDGDTNPVGVKTPVAPNGPAQIRKVNMMLTGRTEAVMRETGDFLRQTLTTQVSLRSLSYIDRYATI